MKKKNLKLALKKESISSLNPSDSKKIQGGNYPSAYTNCGGGGGSGNSGCGDTVTLCLYSCSCTLGAGNQCP